MNNKFGEAFRIIVKDENIKIEPNCETTNFDGNTIFIEKLENDFSNYEKIKTDTEILAIKHIYHDDEIHTQIIQNNLDAKNLLEQLEQYRYTKLCENNYGGVYNRIYNRLKQNLPNAFDNKYAYYTNTLFDILFENGKSIDFSKYDAELYRYVKNLANNIYDQKQFGLNVVELFNHINNQHNKQESETERFESPENYDNDSDINDSFDDENDSSDDSNNTKNEHNDTQQKPEKDKQNKDLDNRFLPVNDDSFEETSTDLDKAGFGENPSGEIDPLYKVYTTKYDIISHAKNLASNNELNQYRKIIDEHLKDNIKEITKLVNKLNRKINNFKKSRWSSKQETGHLDTKMLTQIITNPYGTNHYKQVELEKTKDTCISILIDNSGSMRGKAILLASITADIVSMVMDKCNIKTEILGFTTKNWKGGLSKKDWEQNDKPPQPGRLNDLLHIIYKSHNETYQRSKNNLGLMHKEGILKENIDGEALLWTLKRIQSTNYENKTILVISDGAPIDDETLSHNPRLFLDKNLRKTITHIENKTDVNLMAIGIGHNVNKYYKNATTIKNSENLVQTVIEKVEQLFE